MVDSIIYFGNKEILIISPILKGRPKKQKTKKERERNKWRGVFIRWTTDPTWETCFILREWLTQYYKLTFFFP